MDLKNEIINFIREGDTEKALRLALDNLGKEFSSVLIQLTSRFKKNETDRNNQIITEEDYLSTLNKIRISFLNLINDDTLIKGERTSITEEEAKDILLHTDQLIENLRNIDDDFRKIISKVAGFSLQQNKEERTQISDQISDFVQEEKFLSKVRVSLDFLSHKKEEIPSSDSIYICLSKIISLATIIKKDSLEGPVTPMRSYKILYDFLDQIKSATSEEDVLQIRNSSFEFLELIDRDLLRNLDTKMGELQSLISKHFPGLISELYKGKIRLI